jgi:hypothetical protein
MGDEIISKALKDANDKFVAEYKEVSAAYRAALDEGKVPAVPYMNVAVGGMVLKKDGLAAVFSDATIVKHTFECPPSEDIKKLPEDVVKSQIYSDSSDYLKKIQSLEYIFNKFPQVGVPPVTILEYKEATADDVFHQCADNYEKANEELPKRLNPQMIARR